MKPRGISKEKMKAVAFISDIHGNLEALEATLRFLKNRGVETIHCLGDLVGYGPDPGPCTALIRKHCHGVVAGNHDWAVIGKTPIDLFNPMAEDTVLWTRRILSSNEVLYLENLPLILEIKEGILAHASPINPEAWFYVTDSISARVTLDTYPKKRIFIGHTHIPQAFSSWSKGIRELAFPFTMKGEIQYLINVGSVGQPRDGDPRACALTIENEKAILWRIPYDVETTVQKIKERGLPKPLGQRLLLGI